MADEKIENQEFDLTAEIKKAAEETAKELQAEQIKEEPSKEEKIPLKEIKPEEKKPEISDKEIMEILEKEEGKKEEVKKKQSYTDKEIIELAGNEDFDLDSLDSERIRDEKQKEVIDSLGKMGYRRARKKAKEVDVLIDRLKKESDSAAKDRETFAKYLETLNVKTQHEDAEKRHQQEEILRQKEDEEDETLDPTVKGIKKKMREIETTNQQLIQYIKNQDSYIQEIRWKDTVSQIKERISMVAKNNNITPDQDFIDDVSKRVIADWNMTHENIDKLIDDNTKIVAKSRTSSFEPKTVEEIENLIQKNPEFVKILKEKLGKQYMEEYIKSKRQGITTIPSTPGKAEEKEKPKEITKMDGTDLSKELNRLAEETWKELKEKGE